MKQSQKPWLKQAAIKMPEANNESVLAKLFKILKYLIATLSPIIKKQLLRKKS